MVMENGFCSPRSDGFPAGLRVLVVDDDPTWLKILEKMLKKCSYEVTTCGLASEALKLLRDRKDGFDIVISDVNMPDMDGFKLLEHVGLEMDLPVIMMSVDGETSRVMKGVQHGACDYLLKPIRMKELKNIWQHVVRKKMHEVRDIECIDDRIGPDHFHDGHFGGEQNFLKKRKDVDNKYDEKDTNDPSATKKARVVWTVELHQKFVKAVDQLGIDSDRIGPKKILDLMNVPWLTRENVASHLQKYRLYLSRLRKEEDKLDSSCGGMENPDNLPKESSGSFGIQNSTFAQPSDISDEYMYKGNQLSVPTAESKHLDTNSESSNLLPLTEHRATFSPDSHTVKNSPLSLNHTFGSLDMSAKHTSFDPWSAEVPDVQFEPEFKPHLKLDNCFNQPAVAILQQHINPDLLEPPSQISPALLDPAPLIGHDVLETAPQIGSHLLEPAPHISSGPSISDANHLGLTERKPSQAEEGEVSNHSNEFSVSDVDAFGCVFSQGLNSVIEQPPLLEKSTHSIPIHSENELLDAQGLETRLGAMEMKRPSSCQGSAMVQSTEFEPRHQMLGSEPASGTLGDDMMFRWIQCGDNTSKDLGFDCIGLSGGNFLEHELDSLPLYVPKFDTEYPFEWVEYPFDHGILFS